MVTSVFISAMFFPHVIINKMECHKGWFLSVIFCTVAINRRVDALDLLVLASALLF
jgi:hypothetical protein